MDAGIPKDPKRRLIGSQGLASFLARLSLRDLPGEAARLLKLCVLDHFGCALGALGTPAASVLYGYLAGAKASGLCTVLGRSHGAPPELSALVNGTLSHVLVFDDLHRRAKLHPGVAVIPAAFAGAQIAGASGARLLEAIAAGYEATARIGVAIGMGSHRHLGWRATGTCGSFGAAVAAARALGLDSRVMHHALAAAAAQASGNWAFQENGGMELYLAAGTAARNGLNAALLAAGGFRGAAAPLEARDGGFFMLASREARPELLCEELGRRYLLQETCIKMYPTCHSTHTAIDAVLNLKAKHGIAAGDVVRIEVRAGEITRLQCGWPYAPAAPARLIFHMGYALALALVRGRLLPADFEGASPRDAELVRLASATEVIAEPELTAVYAERKPCDVTLYLRDGRTLRERVEYCRGEPENPASEEALIGKFNALAAPFLPRASIDEFAGLVLSLERQTTLGRLDQILRTAT
jgi:2-methylcitrate dehydratase PrpD